MPSNFMRMWRAVVIAGLAIAFGTTIAAPARADVTYTYGVGGEGGGIFGLPCSGNDVMVGFHYRAGKAMDAIQPICEGVLNGNTTGPTYLANWAGGPGGDGYDSMCPQNQVIVALRVWWDGNGDIHHVRATCHVIAGNVIGHYLAATKTKGGVPIADAGTKCPSGSVASGLTGFSDSLIHKLGLQCTSFNVPATAATPPANDTAPAPAADTTPPPDNTPAPAAATRTAAEATTVYDKPAGNEIAYIDAGDPVTIVSCADGGQGWCKISKPKPGYVWGADLN